MLTVTTAASSYNLTTLEAVKTDLDISSSEDDAQLNDLIEAASIIVADHCRRVFATETVQEILRPDMCHEDIVLQRFPVTSITSIVEDGTTLVATDYEANLANGAIARLYNNRPCYWSTAKIVITYQSGFTLPGNENANLPAPIERATIDVVKSLYFAAGRDPLLRSDDVPGLQAVTYYKSTGAELPPGVAALLGPYRNRTAR